MSDINRALGAAGAPYPLTAGGKTYRLTPITKGVQGAFEQWLKSLARAEVHAMKGELSQEDYVASLAKVARDGAAGLYRFTGDVAAEKLQTVEGTVYLFWLMLQKHHAEMTEDDVFEFVLANHAECVAALQDMTEGVKKKWAAAAESR